MFSVTFIAALFIKSETENNLILLNWRMDKANVVYLQDGVLYSIKNDILKFVGQWMNLENIILSEVTQNQKDK